MWNVLLDEAFAPDLACWQKGAAGICVRSLAHLQHCCMPRSLGDKASWTTSLTFANDMILLATGREEVRKVHQDLIICYDQWGLSLRADMLCMWSNFLGEGVCLGGGLSHRMLACFLGCMLSGDRLGL